MSQELMPSVAASLALNVYSVNGNDKFALKTFMQARVFAKNGDKALLTAEVGGRVFRATKDGFGLCAIGGGKYEGDLFLIFRGTTDKNNNADVITDARIGICTSKTGLPVHIGFNHTFNSMLPDIRLFISKAKATGYIHCIGHSLGGAVASLVADWVSKNTAYTPKLYTFGAPRVGTDWFVKSTTSTIREKNMHRVYHRTDPVPMVALYPFMQAPYASFAHFIYSAEPLISGEAHRMGKYVKTVEGTSWASLSGQPDQPYNIEKAIENWLRSKSSVDSSSATFWRWVDSALIYVLKKVAMERLILLQGAFIGIMTIADKLAYILAKGLELAEHISMWVELLMRKLMQALNMKVAETKKELTRDLMRYVLQRITEKANRDARNALRKLS